MAIADLSNIKSVLQQMSAMADMAAAPKNAAASSPASGGFAAELQHSLQRVSALQDSANTQAQAFELGTPGVSLNNVMIDMQKANIAFQATVQVRNRLVAAYQEIASMPV
ncbi:MAG: flagellar hook-basal body complex protein FliE [Paralcaligenes sp.]